MLLQKDINQSLTSKVVCLQTQKEILLSQVLQTKW